MLILIGDEYQYEYGVCSITNTMTISIRMSIEL